jgi:hypothetical protein
MTAQPSPEKHTEEWVCSYQPGDTLVPVFDSFYSHLPQILMHMKKATARQYKNFQQIRQAAAWWESMTNSQRLIVCGTDPVRRCLIVPEVGICTISNAGRQILILPPTTREFWPARWAHHHLRINPSVDLCTFLGIPHDHRTNYAIIVLTNKHVSPLHVHATVSNEKLRRVVYDELRIKSADDFAQRYYNIIKTSLVNMHNLTLVKNETKHE